MTRVSIIFVVAAAVGGCSSKDYSQTLSCYDPDPAGRACGGCDSCQLRKKGFAEAGVPDPTAYAEPHA